MLNILTVHWQSSKWVEPQLRYLERNLDIPFRVFASLNGIDDPEVWERFHFAAELDGSHAEKLNALGQMAVERSAPTDLLLFLDGDAFPVRPIGTWVQAAVAEFPLVAVRRDENLGDCQPHPCFCATTTQFWSDIGGDWREGGTWVNSVGQTTTDVGGNLLHQLADRDIEWLPLLRTNAHNPNALWFGVYDHRVYHHGAGFRPRISRVDHHAETAAQSQVVAPTRGPNLEGLAVRALRQPASLTRLRPRHLSTLGSAATRSWAKRKLGRHERRRMQATKRAEAYEQSVFARLLTDPDFFLEFDDGGP
jgi:hypothetical protein